MFSSPGWEVGVKDVFCRRRHKVFFTNTADTNCRGRMTEDAGCRRAGFTPGIANKSRLGCVEAGFAPGGNDKDHPYTQRPESCTAGGYLNFPYTVKA